MKLSSRIVMCSCLTGGSTSVMIFVPNRNLPRNCFALCFALSKRDFLYFVIFTGFILYVSSISISCDAVGGFSFGVSKPSSCPFSLKVAGGNIGAVVGLGGSGWESRLNVC